MEMLQKHYLSNGITDNSRVLFFLLGIDNQLQNMYSIHVCIHTYIQLQAMRYQPLIAWSWIISHAGIFSDPTLQCFCE